MRGERPGQVWITQHDPEVLRPYMVTQGGTRPRYPMQLDTMLTVTGGAVGALQPEAAHALELCRHRNRTVAEVAGLLDHPVLVTKIILSGLIDEGVLAIPTARAKETSGNMELLQRTLTGLRALKVS